MVKDLDSEMLFFDNRKSKLKQITQDCLHAFYENDIDKEKPVALLNQLIRRITQIEESKIIQDVEKLVGDAYYRGKPTSERDDNRIKEHVTQQFKNRLYEEFDPKIELNKIKRNRDLLIDENHENFEKKFTKLIDEHNITLTDQKYPQPSIIDEFYSLFLNDPMLCSELMAGLRKFCDVAKPAQYEFIKPSLDYCITNFDEATDLFLDSEVNHTEVTRGINKSLGSPIENAKKLTSRLILVYERGMVSKFNGDLYMSLRIMENLLNALKEYDEDNGGFPFLDFIKHSDETIDHQIFTFPKPQIYVIFQINLLKSRLGQKEMKWGTGKNKGNSNNNEKTVEQNMELIKSQVEGVGYLHDSVAQNSKDRILVHVDTLMRRHHYDDYMEWLEDKGQDWEKYLKNQRSTNKKMFNHINYRWKGKEQDWSSKRVREVYTQNLEKLREKLEETETSAEDITIHPRNLLNKIGDISINNPLYRHSGNNPFSFLSFIHERGGIAEKTQLSDMKDLFDIENEPESFERILITNHSMITGDIGRINRSSVYADCAFINSLRVEKLRRNDKENSSEPLSNRVIVHSTGQLQNMSFEFLNEYHRTLRLELEDSELTENESKYALVNHFLNSYNWMTLFKDDGKSLSPTFTLKLNRINVMGKGIRELMNITSFSKQSNLTSELTSKRLSQTLAENHPFSVISIEDKLDFDKSPNKFVGYLSLFAVNRLEELIMLLQQVQLSVKSIALPLPYSDRVKRLVLKYSKLVEYELNMIEVLWKLVLGKQKDVKSNSENFLQNFSRELEDYTNPDKSKKRLQKIYLKFASELKQIRKLIHYIRPTNLSEDEKSSDIVRYISNLRKSCKTIACLVDVSGQCADSGSESSRSMSEIESLVKKRKSIMKEISDSTSEISASNTFYTRLLTARSITEYEEMFPQKSKPNV